ncbi:MAG: hypothetical protein RR334_02140 [Clostridia bacterium]
MFVYDVIKNVGQVLGLSDILTEVESFKTSPNTFVPSDKMKTIIAFVSSKLREISRYNFPLRQKEIISLNAESTFSLKNLTHVCYDVLRLTDVLDNRYDFIVSGSNVYASSHKNRTCIIYYLAESPSVSSLADEISCDIRVSIDILTFGVCALYCLTKVLTEESICYENKYKDLIDSAKNTIREKNVRFRGWA